MKKTAIATALGFPSLILLGFILCMHPLAQGWSLEEGDFTILAADIGVIPLQKEVAESVPQFAAASALGFGGRKMMAAKVDKETLNAGFLHQKKHNNILGQKPPLISATGSSYYIAEAVDSPTTQHSSATAIDGEEEAMTITETIMVEKKKKLLEDSLEDEIANLMHKDYDKGPPKGKRKPPINNHEPVH